MNGLIPVQDMILILPTNIHQEVITIEEIATAIIITKKNHRVEDQIMTDTTTAGTATGAITTTITTITNINILVKGAIVMREVTARVVDAIHIDIVMLIKRCLK